MVQPKMKVLWLGNTTSYLVTGLFDLAMSCDRSSLIIGFLLLMFLHFAQ